MGTLVRRVLWFHYGVSTQSNVAAGLVARVHMHCSDMAEKLLAKTKRLSKCEKQLAATSDATEAAKLRAEMNDIDAQIVALKTAGARLPDSATSGGGGESESESGDEEGTSGGANADADADDDDDESTDEADVTSWDITPVKSMKQIEKEAKLKAKQDELARREQAKAAAKSLKRKNTASATLSIVRVGAVADDTTQSRHSYGHALSATQLSLSATNATTTTTSSATTITTAAAGPLSPRVPPPRPTAAAGSGGAPDVITRRRSLSVGESTKLVEQARAAAATLRAPRNYDDLSLLTTATSAASSATTANASSSTMVANLATMTTHSSSNTSSTSSASDDSKAAADSLYVEDECRWLVFVRKDVKKRLIKQSLAGVAALQALESVEGEGSSFRVSYVCLVASVLLVSACCVRVVQKTIECRTV
jgi:hypothetical protein